MRKALGSNPSVSIFLMLLGCVHTGSTNATALTLRTQATTAHQPTTRAQAWHTSLPNPRPPSRSLFTHSSTYPPTHIRPPPPTSRYCIRTSQIYRAVSIVREKALPQRAERAYKLASTAMRKWSRRHQGDSNPCGQSPMDSESISLAVQTQCLYS